MSNNVCASVRALTSIKDVTEIEAKRVRAVWRDMTREQLLEEFPRVAEYARQCFNPPDTRILRRMAVDSVIETYGVEYLGVHRRTGAHIYYCNTGDTYATTVLFSGAHLRVGCWGDLVEHDAIREANSHD